MATKAVQHDTVSSKLISKWQQVNQKLAALAEEFPANKFDYRPADSVRTIAETLRHVAYWNQYVADKAQGTNADDTGNELPKDEFATKAKIISAMQRTASGAAGALHKNSAGLSPELTETLVSFIEHNCEHYGQLVVYARLLGIVPPASRG
jgi:uncharacterized damage-inducible protein DinB